MPEFKATVCKVLKENITNYSLLEIIHHEVGNGLAVISGYTQLLQRAAEQGALDHEKLESYLQTIAQREAHLNGFLTQMRELVLQPAHTKFCKSLASTDIIPFAKSVVNRLVPLFQDKNILLHLPTQPLCITCDPLWVQLAIEHVLSHYIAFHQGSAPISIDVERYDDPYNLHHEAHVSIHITKRPGKRRPIPEDHIFETWIQTLDERDQDVCIALCCEILQEHGGRLWVEQGPGQDEGCYIALPLASV